MPYTHKTNTCLDCNICLVRSDSVFSVLSQQETEELQRSKGHLIFNYGELIFKEGQYPNGIYIITQGKVKISKFGFEGREQIVRFATVGDILGYRSLISEEKYSCTAAAVSETHLCYLSQEVISKYLRSNPELGFQFMKLLATDLRNAEERSIRMAQKPVRERIAEAIILLKEVYGYEEDNSTININLKRDEIAGLAGTVRETATRLLSEFCEDEIIVVNGRKIKILDLNKLEKSANHSF